MKGKLRTYKDFLNAISGSSTGLSNGQVDGILQRFKLPKAIQSRFAPATFLLDYTSRKYLYVESTCLDVTGYTAEYFLETGLDQFNSRWHPSDFEVLNTYVFSDNFSFLSQLCRDDYDKYIFSYNYRFKSPRDEYITLLQRFSFIPGDDSIGPAGVVGVVFDITHFKNDTTIVHTIERVESTSAGNINTLIHKKIHPVFEKVNDRLLSKREREILLLMAQGLSSKQIAAQTHLSINTINNHRKNMLLRTSSKSSTELVGFALKHGLV